jgi:hypothetical protein
VSDLNPFDEIITASPPWWAVVGASIAAFVARVLLGRHLKTLDKVVELAGETKRLVELIDRRVSVIEGRFRERDNISRSTWPHNHDP